MLNRRTCLSMLGAASFAIGKASALGQDQHRYRVVENWGVLDQNTPVKNCHGIVRDHQGHIILLTDHVANNVIVYDKSGKLISKWGTSFPGAHGLSIVNEGSREVLYITDLVTHKVTKSTLDGKILNEWGWPEGTGKYKTESEYKPSWTLHMKDGSFFVLDGYGKDYIHRYAPDGKLAQTLGGSEGGITHWGPHGGMIDHAGNQPTLLIAMSDQQYLLRLSTQGEKLQQIDLPGGNPRQIRFHNGYYYVAHLADNWPKDRKSRGFVSVLDQQFRVVSNIAGSAPSYEGGNLKKMNATDQVFQHPHDLILDEDDSIYVAQFDSGATYPIKLERI